MVLKQSIQNNEYSGGGIANKNYKYISDHYTGGKNNISLNKRYYNNQSVNQLIQNQHNSIDNLSQKHRYHNRNITNPNSKDYASLHSNYASKQEGTTAQ